jgi:hypothetical protein
MNLCMDELSNPLRGWIKALSPPFLEEAIKKARDVEAYKLKRKFQSKVFSLKKVKIRNHLIRKHISHKVIQIGLTMSS